VAASELDDDQLSVVFPCSMTLSPMRRVTPVRSARRSGGLHGGVHFDSSARLVAPPGLVAVSSYTVVCRGETVLSPVVGTGLRPLISASTVSLEVQATECFGCSDIWRIGRNRYRLQAATATVATSSSALKRCTPPPRSLDPRGQSLTTCFPFEMSTITR